MTTLVSPGISVPISDESAYAAPGSGTIPLILIATQQDKPDPTGEATDNIAPYTKKMNAGTVITATSQRDLTQMFGTAYFAEQEASETSEYGLLAAYSYLGQGSRAIIVRADVDMAQLEPMNDEPVGPAALGAYWLDTSTSSFGIHEYDLSIGSWVRKEPITVYKALELTDDSSDASALVATLNGSNGPSGTSGDYLVAVLSNTGRPAGQTYVFLGYYKHDGTDWGLVTSSFNPHYDAPDSPSNGDTWVKTTRPGNGLNLNISRSDINGNFGLVEIEAIDSQPSGIDYQKQDASSTTEIANGSFTSGNITLSFDDGLEIELVGESGTAASLTKEISVNDMEPNGEPVEGRLWYDETKTNLEVLKRENTAATISGITLTTGTPVSITATAHGFNTGNRVRITGVVGTTELNGNFYTINTS